MINETQYRNNPLTKEQENNIDAVFSQYDTLNEPGCTVGIIKDDRFIYKKSFGLANLDYDIQITSESKFEIASVTKHFTATCIMLLVADNQLNLTDNIRKYFPELPVYEKDITIHHLLNHTSGIKNYLTILKSGNYLFDGTIRENYISNSSICKIILEQKELDFLPGEKFSYSITGYLLLAELVKIISGKSLCEFADEHIFKTIGMKNTFIDDNCKQIVKNRVDSYNKIDNHTFTRYIHCSEDVGSKGVVTTLNDLQLWNYNFYSGKIIGTEFVELMTTKSKLDNGVVIDYGYGFEIYDQDSERFFGHGGKWLGFRSQMMRIPKKSLTIICLGNRSDFLATDIAKQIAKMLNGKLQKTTLAK